MFDRKLFQVAVQSKLAKERLSLRGVAQHTGVSVSTLSRIQRGYAPDVDSFAAIVTWLDIDANAFLGSPVGGELRDIEKWAWLKLCLDDLQVPQDLGDAFIAIVRLIQRERRSES